jgi:hypothetical protein
VDRLVCSDRPVCSVCVRVVVPDWFGGDCDYSVASYGGVGVFVFVFYAVPVGDWYMEYGCWFRAVICGFGHNGQMGGNGILMCPGMRGWAGGVSRLGWLCDR